MIEHGKMWSRTNKPGGAVTQLGPRCVNHQRPITLLHCIHSVHPAFVNPATGQQKSCFILLQ